MFLILIVAKGRKVNCLWLLMRDHWAIPQEVQFFNFHYCLTIQGKSNSFSPTVSLCRRGTWNNNIPHCCAFHGFIQKLDRGTTFAAPCSLFPGLGLQLQLFWKKHFGELYNWWPVFLLWVFNQYLWGFGGKRAVAPWLDLNLYRFILFIRFFWFLCSLSVQRRQHRDVTQVSCVPD